MSLAMMPSSNGNIFRVTGPLCGEFTGPGEFPTQRPVTRSFDVFFDLRPNKRLSKQWRGWWFETLSRPFWRHRNGGACCQYPEGPCLNSECAIYMLIDRYMNVYSFDFTILLPHQTPILMTDTVQPVSIWTIVHKILELNTTCIWLVHRAEYGVPWKK